jgi:hypothetical protein
MKDAGGGCGPIRLTRYKGLGRCLSVLLHFVIWTPSSMLLFDLYKIIIINYLSIICRKVLILILFVYIELHTYLTCIH